MGNSLSKETLGDDIYSSGEGLIGSSMWLRHLGSESNTLDYEIINCTFTENQDDSSDAGYGSKNVISVGATSATARVKGFLRSSIFYGNTISDSLLATRSLGTNTGSNGGFKDVVSISKSSSDSIHTIDASGNSFFAGTIDLINSQRVYNTTVDLGAYKFGSITLGLSDFDSGQFKIVTDKAIKTIEIYDLSGVLVVVSTGNSAYINQLSAGLYIAKITTRKKDCCVVKFLG